MNELQLPSDIYEAIASEISSEQSVVGIDAKKTHILILHLLLDIQKRLDRLEATKSRGNEV